MNVEVITLRAFHKRPGKVFAPATLTADMSDYVQVSKADLIARLRVYEITHVEIITQADGTILFQGGTTEEGHYL